MRKKDNPSYLERLPARPIMIYPRSAEQRQQIEEAAAKQGQGLSPFVLDMVLGVIAPSAWATEERAKIAAREKTVKAAKKRLEEARKRLLYKEDESAVA